MATLNNPNYSLSPGLGLAGQVQLVDSKDIVVATGDIALNGLIKAFKARKGQMVVGAILSVASSIVISQRSGASSRSGRIFAADPTVQAVVTNCQKIDAEGRPIGAPALRLVAVIGRCDSAGGIHRIEALETPVRTMAPLQFFERLAALAGDPAVVPQLFARAGRFAVGRFLLV